MVVINGMPHKPKNCTVCPMCRYSDDGCVFQFAHRKTWDEQYSHCPLEEVNTHGRKTDRKTYSVQLSGLL